MAARIRKKEVKNKAAAQVDKKKGWRIELQHQLWSCQGAHTVPVSSSVWSNIDVGFVSSLFYFTLKNKRVVVVVVVVVVVGFSSTNHHHHQKLLPTN
jgi:hypothetical protein